MVCIAHKKRVARSFGFHSLEYRGLLGAPSGGSRGGGGVGGKGLPVEVRDFHLSLMACQTSESRSGTAGYRRFV